MLKLQFGHQGEWMSEKAVAIIDVPAGTELMQALRLAGVDMDFPCGG